jgi:hypothetical protein
VESSVLRVLQLSHKFGLHDNLQSVDLSSQRHRCTAVITVWSALQVPDTNPLHLSIQPPDLRHSVVADKYKPKEFNLSESLQPQQILVQLDMSISKWFYYHLMLNNES